MKIRKKLTIILLLVAFIFFSSVVTFAVEDAIGGNKSTITEIILKKGTDGTTENEKKETIYTPDEAKPVRILPETGEILTSFIYIIIGLSVLLFILGIMISRIIYSNNEFRWEY